MVDTERNDREPVAPEARRSRRGDLPSLSRRIISWSGNLLATSVIIILGLTFGRQVLQWWQGDPSPARVITGGVDSELGGLGDARVPHLLAFGDLPLTFERSQFEGSELAALAQLRAACREFLERGRPVAIPVSDEALRRLRSSEAVEEGIGWRIVQYRGPIITVVALQMPVDATSAGTDVAGQGNESVVSWGLGLRAAETGTEKEARASRWTLFTCSGRNHPVDASPDLSPPTPPGSQRCFVARVEQGGALIAFTCPQSMVEVRQYCDRSWGDVGWSRKTRWTSIGSTCHARFRHDAGGQCDVQLMDNTSGTTSGIVTVAPAQQ